MNRYAYAALLASALRLAGCSRGSIEERLVASRPEDRQSAVESLSPPMDEGIVRIVGEILLSDPELSVRVSAAEALARSGTPRALEQLGMAGAQHRDVTTKVAAVEALARSRRLEAIPILISLWALADDQDGGVVTLGVDRAIATFAQDASPALVDAALRHRDAKVRMSAARALRGLSSLTTVQQTIAAAVVDPDPDVAKNALALQQFLNP